MIIFFKLFAGFLIFFVGVVLNVMIMKNVEGKPSGIMPPISMILIITGLIFLVVMVNTIKIG